MMTAASKRLSLVLLSVATLFCSVATFGKDAGSSLRFQLEKEILRKFFPPKGWCFTDAEATAVLRCDGGFEKITLVKHLVDSHGRKSPDADFAVKAAIGLAKLNKSALKGMGCPIKSKIRFLVKDPAHGGYFCRVDFDEAAGKSTDKQLDHTDHLKSGK